MLRERAGERPEWAAAVELLSLGAGPGGASARPFDFYARALGRLDGQGRSMRRADRPPPGPEARDVLDAFLAEALKAERRGVRDLESFVADMAASDRGGEARAGRGRGRGAGDDRPRRQGAGGAHRLPARDGLARRRALPSLLQTEAGGFLWCASGKADGPASAAARRRYGERRDAEALRLLYVGLTRARDRLVVVRRASPGRQARERRRLVRGGA